jgi:hypothetical protein
MDENEEKDAAFDLIRNDIVIADSTKYLRLINFASLCMILVIVGVSDSLYLTLVLISIVVFTELFSYDLCIKSAARERDRIGELIFRIDCIQIISEKTKFEIQVSDIERINLNYNYIRGEQFFSRSLLHNGLAEIIISKKSGEIIRVQFVIDFRAQLERLRRYWKSYYQKGIEISEYIPGDKINTVLFEHPGSYKKKQDLKKEISIQ